MSQKLPVICGSDAPSLLRNHDMLLVYAAGGGIDSELIGAADGVGVSHAARYLAGSFSWEFIPGVVDSQGQMFAWGWPGCRWLAWEQWCKDFAGRRILVRRMRDEFKAARPGYPGYFEGEAARTAIMYGGTKYGWGNIRKFILWLAAFFRLRNQPSADDEKTPAENLVCSTFFAWTDRVGGRVPLIQGRADEDVTPGMLRLCDVYQDLCVIQL